jgi:hypothetical protein
MRKCGGKEKGSWEGESRMDSQRKIQEKNRMEVQKGGEGGKKEGLIK